GTLRIVVGLDGLTVFVYGALALPGGIKDLAQHHMAPHFSPAGLLVAGNGLAVFIGCGLVIALQVEDFSNAVVGEGAVLVYIERFIELRQRFREIARLGQLLSTADGDPG